jgi:hypothetical protein
MRAYLDLNLLGEELKSLIETSFFGTRLREYCRQLTSVIDDIQNVDPRPPEIVFSQVANAIWEACTFLKGSISREIPFEVVYCLETALRDWEQRPAIITTALLERKDFFFRQFDPWHTICSVFPATQCSADRPILVHMALPRLYRRFPLFIIPLYHELGHFIDTAASISRTSFMLEGRGSVTHTELRHRMEHFADLFAASYCGNASSITLNELAPSHPASKTHPATVDRTALIEEFLAGRNHPLISLLNTALAVRG